MFSFRHSQTVRSLRTKFTGQVAPGVADVLAKVPSRNSRRSVRSRRRRGDPAKGGGIKKIRLGAKAAGPPAGL